MTAVAVLLGSVLGCALLGGGVAWRRAALARRPPAKAEGGERALHDAVRALLDATRTSSDAVLAALDRNLRALDDGVDTTLIFAAREGELTCVYASGARAEHFARASLSRDDLERLPARAAQAGCRAVSPQDGAALLPTDRAALAAPMLDARGLRAVVYVSSCEAQALAARDALVLAVDCAALPYALALEREADRADATYDGLTGVLTPRAFRRHLHDEVAKAASGGGAIASLWFVDTDRFKSVNDRFGHRAGDSVLQAMAALLEASLVPDLDAAARNGGDEFCALIRGASKSAAIERAQAFCETVRAHDFGIPMRVTASVGVATFPFDATTSSELLEVADAAMYHSKREGRDRVSFALERGRYAVFD
jgi:diguanylate cyclase (GGDEF)-like protein